MVKASSLIFCLLIFSLIGRAQPNSFCHYHVKFYRWELNIWHYVGTWDSGEAIKTGDVTARLMIYNEPSDGVKPQSTIKLDSAALDSFINFPQKIIVTSCDGKTRYNVDHFQFSVYYGLSSLRLVEGSDTTDGSLLKEHKALIYKYGLELDDIEIISSEVPYKTDDIDLNLLIWNPAKRH